MSKSIDDVINQLRSAGLQVDAVEVDTNDIVRVPVEGDKGSKKSGWYRVYTHISKAGNTYYVGRFGNWKNDAIPENGQNLRFDNEGLSAEDRRAIKAQQDKARKQAANEKKRKQSEAAKRAGDIWRGLPEPMPDEPTGNPYLVNKKVGAFGVRYAKNKALVVPLRSISGDLVGLQFIHADGSKRFLTGTAKQGAFHAIGEIDPEGVAVIAEGYATAATVFMATGQPALVAFDAGNLVPVAEALHKQYPKLRLVIAADDDSKGRECANKAAGEVGAAVVLPRFADTEKAGTDVNDLHAAEGLQVVAEQFRAALAGEVEPPQPGTKSKGPQQPSDGAEFASPFINTDRGLFYHDNESERRIWICDRLDVLGRARNDEGKDWGVLVQFANREGIKVTHLIYDRLFASENGQQIYAQLLDLGLKITAGRSKKRLLQYLQEVGTDRFIRLVNKLGWNRGCYLQPGYQIGTPDEPLYYYSGRLPLCASAVAGELEEWQQQIGRYCVGNPLLAFCVSVSFVGPLLKLIDSETFGIHLFGESSKGKSTGLFVASSVCGGADYLKRWNNTSNALEPMAAEHSDGLLVLDEISQSLPHEVGSTVYMLGNGLGKGRATDTGMGTRQRLTWRLVFLSSGEHTLAQHMDTAGRKAMAGMEVRLLNIPATRFEHGAFATIHDFADGDKFAKHIEQASRIVYGSPLRVFIEKLCSLTPAKRDELIAYLKRLQGDFQSAHLTSGASGQAYRAASKFALVAAAGEVASRWGLLPWPKGEALRAADELFKLWLDERGGDGNKEDRELLEHLASELLGKSESHFTRWDGEEDSAKADTHQIRSQDRWGFRRTESEGHGDDCHSEEWLYVYPAKFRAALCKGFDYKAAGRLLMDCGALKVTTGRGLMYNTKLPGGGSKRQGVYCIKLSALINFDRRDRDFQDAA